MHLNAVGGDCPGKTELHARHPARARRARGGRVRAAVAHRRRDPADAEPDFPVTEFTDVLSGRGARTRSAAATSRSSIRSASRSRTSRRCATCTPAPGGARRAAADRPGAGAGRSEGPVRRCCAAPRTRVAARADQLGVMTPRACGADRRADRHRRRRPRRFDGAGGAARRGPAGRAARRGPGGRRPRQPERPGKSVAAARRTAIATCAEVVRLESRWCTRRVYGRAAPGAAADPARRRSLPGIGSISAVARHCRERGQETARAVARRARRLQHQRAVAERQHPRHAGRLPVRLRPARADRPSAA